MERPKIFGIGFHKTATTSLAAALTQLGYRVTGPNWRKNPKIAEEVHSLAFDCVPKFDAFQDNPWPLLYRELDARFPGSKFVLTLRPASRWIPSVVEHFGGTSTPMREWIYGAGCGDPTGREDLYVERYERHNREVMAYFADRPSDLLVLRITEGDGWEKLCPFLGLPVAEGPFPKTNSSRDRKGLRRLTHRVLIALNLRFSLQRMKAKAARSGGGALIAYLLVGQPLLDFVGDFIPFA
jgi:hypothetical protein